MEKKKKAILIVHTASLLSTCLLVVVTLLFLGLQIKSLASSSATNEYEISVPAEKKKDYLHIYLVRGHFPLLSDSNPQNLVVSQICGRISLTWSKHEVVRTEIGFSDRCDKAPPNWLLAVSHDRVELSDLEEAVQDSQPFSLNQIESISGKFFEIKPVSLRNGVPVQVHASVAISNK